MRVRSGKPLLSLIWGNAGKGRLNKMKTFEINGKRYTVKPFDFNMVCDLEEYGFWIDSIGRNNMSLLRGYVALCGDMDKDIAGKEIEQHIFSGGKLDDVFNIINTEIENSDFFRSLSQSKEQENSENPEIETEEETESK